MKESDFKSSEELYFFWYLSELKESGFVKEFRYEPYSLVLGKAIDLTAYVKSKKVIKEKPYPLIKERDYTLDFEIEWTELAYDIFFRTLDCPYSPDIPFLAQGLITLLEVKGNFDMNGKVGEAKIKRDWLMYQHGIYVQVVIPVPRMSKGKVLMRHAVFNKTFTPQRYLLTNKDMTKRTINYEVRSLEEYVALRRLPSKFI